MANSTPALIADNDIHPVGAFDSGLGRIVRPEAWRFIFRRRRGPLALDPPLANVGRVRVSRERLNIGSFCKTMAGPVPGAHVPAMAYAAELSERDLGAA